MKLHEVLHSTLRSEIRQYKTCHHEVYTYRLPSVLHLLVSLVLWRSTEHIEISLSLLRNRQNRCHISAPVAIVRRAPDSDELLVKHELVALLYELVCTCDKRKLVDVVKLKVSHKCVNSRHCMMQGEHVLLGSHFLRITTPRLLD